MSQIKVKQLYELVDGEYKEINPKIDLQSILESMTEHSISYIFHHYNHFNATWTNTQEATRGQVPPQLRRNGLWLSYINWEGKKITERFKGTDLDASTYEKWIDDAYWEELDFELLKAGVKQAVENALNHLDQFVDLKALIKQVLVCVLRDLIDPDWLEDMIGDNILDIINNSIQDLINQYFQGDSFRAYFASIVEGLIGDLLDEYFEDIRQTLLEEERVIANALARHEIAITELQNS